MSRPSPQTTRLLLLGLSLLLAIAGLAVGDSARADAPPPEAPSASSSSHIVGTWSADPTVDAAWSQPAGEGGAVTGYSFEWSQDPSSIPDEQIDTVDHATTSAPLEDGSAHWFHVRAASMSGGWGAAAHLGPFWIDATAPTAHLTRPSTATQTADRFAVSWTGADMLSGIATYDVRYRSSPASAPPGGYVGFLTRTARQSAVFDGQLSSRYCFSVRARDGAGNTGGWSDERCTTVPADADAPHPTCGRVGAPIVRFRVLVERGLDTTPVAFARQLTSILCDERSWVRSGKVRFRYDPNGPLLISARTPDSTERLCYRYTGLSVRRYFSCASAREAVLNADRWFKGSDYLSYSVRQYRRLLVMHEVGHTLGQNHRGCARRGALAPVMMQQSKGLNGCAANVWPLRYELDSLRR